MGRHFKHAMIVGLIFICGAQAEDKKPAKYTIEFSTIDRVASGQSMSGMGIVVGITAKQHEITLLGVSDACFQMGIAAINSKNHISVDANETTKSKFEAGTDPAAIGAVFRDFDYFCMMDRKAYKAKK